MKRVRGGPPNTARARGRIAEARAITPVFNATERSSQEERVAASTAPQPQTDAPRRAPAQDARRVASTQARRTAELKRQRRMRLADKAWKLGPRAYFEFLDELDRHYDIPDLDRRLERYANIDPKALSFLGGDRFPEGPMRAVTGWTP
jgi:hypothetical protein